ncbi:MULTISPECIES: hypothetical protein [Roseobacteraceae]|mgnify:FL=1|jgi:hypothetical protein|uniref:Uncharacterized protein n=1 Tax=Celeribacter baekdonensis TaxID=875171 RepID=A0A1G7FDD4_9RHOB|nr:MULTISPECIES: hypothetical protein [Roseobacteraceae]SDE73963.1 hypothetical protein SAMN04488117_10139 [Celeribacter baekdonensis]|tara:strand:- start:183100 stop:183240 length:141 start_codon:yes stop_codon:yes gene_type:complete
MDLIMTTAIAFGATAVMVAYALISKSQHPTEQRLPIRIRVEDRRKR